MIFVVLGTQKFQLNRLLCLIDEAVEQGAIEEDVIAQIGHSDYHPQHYKYETMMDKDIFEKTIGDADIVITHSGVGTIMTALNAHKPVMVFPRMKKYGEHVDDHQLDIANTFVKKGYVMCYEQNRSIAEQIMECRSRKFASYTSRQSNIIQLIRDYIAE